MKLTFTVYMPYMRLTIYAYLTYRFWCCVMDYVSEAVKEVSKLMVLSAITAPKARDDPFPAF